ncbi:TAXI family TRAP transporter solute-binding subunit [Paracoccus sp. MC1854]|uniref:TAXI family TRAP transporter solute-binding subunit n=1 Tax=Paracoccus sp. MC1854 TaxID=2760306 RepID=UPI001600E31F|nr:TAXI family TRAP transporter solute-binding subunit [Paracoccus sp. MC1854]MBB1492858.1 TAXI family TRAP transporter solute-binding subunit [Paracoccus sp. MC1854]
MNFFSTIRASTIALALGVTGAVAQELPNTMIWTAYDVGSAGYAEASAIADAFGRHANTRIRIQPSGSGIGRLQPLLLGRADYGFLATETYFLSEGDYDYAVPEFGPQNLRAVAGRPASLSMVAAGDAGIETIADARGKRAAFVVGNPSINVKCEAVLAFGDLTLDDVEVVMFPTYAAAMSSMTRNEADFTCTTPTTSQLYELASSPRGIKWVPLDPNDQEGWAKLLDVLPIMGPFEEDIAAGLAPGEKVSMAAYRYPVIVTLADKSADEVYAFTKALDESFDLYKNATATMHRWDLNISGTPPIDVPFHEGAVRYLTEKGIWTDESEAWNQERIARLDALRAAWEEFLPANRDLPPEQFAAQWAEAKAALGQGSN